MGNRLERRNILLKIIKLASRNRPILIVRTYKTNLLPKHSISGRTFHMKSSSCDLPSKVLKITLLF